MPINLRANEFNSAKWREIRPSALKGCNVAKGLDAFVPLYRKGPQRVFDEGKMDEAITKSTALSKALGVAMNKAKKIKGSADKRRAVEVVDAFSLLNASFVDQLLTANLDNSGKVLEQVLNAYATDVDNKVGRVESAIRDTAAAIRRGDAELALMKHGIALNALKGITDLATKKGLEAQIKREARGLRIDFSEVDLKDKKLVKTFKATQKRYKELTAEVDELDDEVDRLAEAVAEREPETANDDRTYKTRLKRMVALYKGVVDESKRGLAKVKQFRSRVGQLPRLVESVDERTAPKVVKAIEMIYDGMHDAYMKVDTHIQETVRADGSTYVIQRREWEITTQDTSKNLSPLMNRAFALNYQCKGQWENGTEDLVDLSEAVLERVDSAEARRLIERMKG